MNDIDVKHYGRCIRQAVRERRTVRLEIDRHHISSGATYSLTGRLVQLNCFIAETVAEIRAYRESQEQAEADAQWREQERAFNDGIREGIERRMR